MSTIFDPIARVVNGQKEFVDRFNRKIIVEQLGLGVIRINIEKPLRGWDREIVSHEKFMDYIR